MILAEALKKTGGKAEGLPEALLSIEGLPGVLGTITFDAFGDVHRDIYILQVENGELVQQEIISAESP